MKKSVTIRISNDYLFQRINQRLPLNRKLHQIEARLMLEDSFKNIYERPKTKNYQYLLKLAKEAFKKRNFKEAFCQIRESIKLLKLSSDSLGDLDRAKIYQLAGKIYKKNYQVKDSIDFFRNSLAIFNRVLGKNHTCFYPIIYELADSYLKQLMPTEAIFIYRHFLTTNEYNYKDNRTQEINTIIHLSTAYFYKFGPKATIKLLKEALKLNRKNFGKYNEFDVKILSKIAYGYAHLEKKDKAKKYFERTFKILTKSSYLQDISRNKIYDLLINYCEITGRHERSLYHAKRAIRYLSKFRKKCDIIPIAEKYRKMSEIHRNENKIEESLYYYHRNLMLLKNTMNLKHSKCLQILLDFSKVLKISGLAKQSLSILKIVFKQFECELVSNNLLRAEFRLITGSIYTELHMTKKAAISLNEAKLLFTQLFGKHHSKYAQCCYYIALTLQLEAQTHQALTAFREVFIEYQRIYSYCSLSCASVVLEIARTYRLRGNIACSLGFYKQSKQIYTELGLKNSYNTRQIYIEIADLYRKQGDIELFFQFLQKSLNLNVTANIAKDHYHDNAFRIIGDYFFDFKCFKAAKMAYIKDLRVQLTNRNNLALKMQVVYRIALCDIKLGNYSNANKVYESYKRMINEKLVSKDEIKDINNSIYWIYLIKAEIYYQTGNYEDCLETSKTVFDLEKNYWLNYNPKLFRIYWFLSKAFLKQKKFQKSVEFLNECLKIELNTYKNPFTISEIYNEFAIICGESGDIDRELKYLKKSLRIRKKKCIENEIGLRKIYHYIGINYTQQKKYNRALKYLNKAFCIAKASKTMCLTSSCALNSIGIVIALQGSFDKSLDAFKFSIKSAITKKFNPSYTDIFIGNYRAVFEARNQLTKDESNMKQVYQSLSLALVHVCPD